MDYLIQAGADLDIVDERGETALMVAYENRPHSQVVYTLIHAGADINAGGLFCLLNQAIWNSDIRMLQKILAIPNVVIPEFAGWNKRSNSGYLNAEKEIQIIFEEAYALPIATRTRGRSDKYQWRNLLSTH